MGLVPTRFREAPGCMAVPEEDCGLAKGVDRDPGRLICFFNDIDLIKRVTSDSIGNLQEFATTIDSETGNRALYNKVYCM